MTAVYDGDVTAVSDGEVTAVYDGDVTSESLKEVRTEGPPRAMMAIIICGSRTTALSTQAPYAVGYNPTFAVRSCRG